MRQLPVRTRISAILPYAGMFPTLAITTTLVASLAMAAALSFVLVLGSVSISLIRAFIPPSVAILVQLSVLAALVIVVDQFLLAYAPQLHRELSIYVGLILTHCLMLGRAGMFAMRHPPLASLLDALRYSAGLSLALILIGALRELLGAGTLLGHVLLPGWSAGGNAPAMVQLAPGALFLAGGLFWLIGAIRPRLRLRLRHRGQGA